MLECAPNAGRSSGCSFYSTVPSLTLIPHPETVGREWGIAWNTFWGEVDPCPTPSCKPHAGSKPMAPETSRLCSGVQGLTQTSGQLSPAPLGPTHPLPPAEAHPGTAVLGRHQAAESWKLLASCVSQLYGDFEQVSQKHPHSCDRDV